MLSVGRDIEAEALLALASARIPDVAAHGERVGRYARSIARRLGLDDVHAGRVHAAARFHDIGKLAIPAALLDAATFDADQRDACRRHVDIGAELLARTATLSDLASIVLASHERFDGSGYPSGQAGLAIPIESRIIAVADTYDALTRPHRNGRRATARDTAIARLCQSAHQEFDPLIVEAFLAVLTTH